MIAVIVGPLAIEHCKSHNCLTPGVLEIYARQNSFLSLSLCSLKCYIVCLLHKTTKDNVEIRALDFEESRSTSYAEEGRLDSQYMDSLVGVLLPGKSLLVQLSLPLKDVFTHMKESLPVNSDLKFIKLANLQSAVVEKWWKSHVVSMGKTQKGKPFNCFYRHSTVPHFISHQKSFMIFACVFEIFPVDTEIRYFFTLSGNFGPLIKSNCYTNNHD